jgi:hypothetical protein
VSPVGAWRELTPGYAAPERFGYTEKTKPSEPAALLHMRVADDRLVCEAVTVRPPAGRSLRAADLRAVHIGEMLQRVQQRVTHLVSFDPYDEHGERRDDNTEVRIHRRMVIGDDGTIKRGADTDAWLVTKPAEKEKSLLDQAMENLTPEVQKALLNDSHELWRKVTEGMTPEEFAAEIHRRRMARPAPVLVDNAGAPRGGRVDPREYEIAADAYNRARRAGDRKPMVAVMDALGLAGGQRQTAWRRVKGARERGLPVD